MTYDSVIQWCLDNVDPNDYETFDIYLDACDEAFLEDNRSSVRDILEDQFSYMNFFQDQYNDARQQLDEAFNELEDTERDDLTGARIEPIDIQTSELPEAASENDLINYFRKVFGG